MRSRYLMGLSSALSSALALSPLGTPPVPVVPPPTPLPPGAALAWNGAALDHLFLRGVVARRLAQRCTRNRLHTWSASPPGFGSAMCSPCRLSFGDEPCHEAPECVAHLHAWLPQTWAAWRAPAVTAVFARARSTLEVRDGSCLVAIAPDGPAVGVLARTTSQPAAVTQPSRRAA